MGALTLFLRFWRPATLWLGIDRREANEASGSAPAAHTYTSKQVFAAWLPWIVLSVCVFLWGLPQIKALLDSVFTISMPVSGLHQLVQKAPPVVAALTAEAAV